MSLPIIEKVGESIKICRKQGLSCRTKRVVRHQLSSNKRDNTKEKTERRINACSEEERDESPSEEKRDVKLTVGPSLSLYVYTYIRA